MKKYMLDSLSQRRLQAWLFVHFHFQPRKVSLQVVFFKPQMFFFPFFRIQLCQFLILDKNLSKFLDALPAGGLGNLFLGHVSRDRIDEVLADMHSAQRMDSAGDFLVPCIPIGLQDSLIFLFRAGTENGMM